MYQKYNTEALVLGSREQGEADRIFALFTKDFGLVYARASSVRRERSRMRYALQNYSRSHVALVRGKYSWRVGGAVAMRGSASVASAVTFARIAKLVTRLVAGEEQNQYLFATLAEAHDALSQESDASPIIELICVARMLHALGYLSSEALNMTLFSHTAYAVKDIEEAHLMHDTLLSSINRAISETHL